MNTIFDELKFKQMIFRETAFSGAQIDSSVTDLAGWLEKNRKSDSPFIHLFARNHVKAMIAYFAAIRAGFAVVLLDPDKRRLEMEDIAPDTPPAATIRIDPTRMDFDYEKEILIHQYPEPVEVRSDLTDVCTLLYTAADSGVAKAVMLTRKNILANVEGIIECDHIDERSVCCGLLPMFHMFGLQTGVLGPIAAGGTVVLEEIDLRQIKAIASHLGSTRVSNIYSVPVVFYLLSGAAELFGGFDGVKSIVSGGYKMLPEVFNRFLQKTGKEIHEGYGLTEASPICTWHRPEDAVKLKSVGRAFHGCDVRILDDEDDECLVEEIGEICIRGDNVMKGYYGEEELTRKTVRNGWLHSGDVGKMDENGYVCITGLKKRMLNVSGRNVYPAEVERFLKMHGNVETAEVHGEFSDIRGNLVNAKVRLKDRKKDTEDGLRKWCLDNMSYYKVPKHIEIL